MLGKQFALENNFAYIVSPKTMLAEKVIYWDSLKKIGSELYLPINVKIDDLVDPFYPDSGQPVIENSLICFCRAGYSLPRQQITINTTLRAALRMQAIRN